MKRTSITVTSIDKVTRSTWDKYVESNQDSSLYHLSVWSELIEKIFGHETYYLVALDQEKKITGVLPMARLKSRLFGDYIVSMPYFNYGGVLANNEQIKYALLDKAVELAKKRQVDHIELRELKPLEKQWQCKQDKVLMYLSLPNTSDELWKAVGSKCRAQIKRLDREDNIEIVQGGAELVDDFYKIFARNMRDLGTPVYAKSLFFWISKSLPDNSHIIVIKKDGKPVAGAFLLGYKIRLEIPWASSLREFNRLGVNMRLYWEVLKYAINKGYDVFDFGRSTRDSGTYRFKKQWGAQPIQCYWHYWLNDKQSMPELNPDNPRYKLAIKVWQRLPIAMTKLIGPSIVKNLP